MMLSSAAPTIYLDHAATTPVDPARCRGDAALLQREFGNPSSLYGLGRRRAAPLDAPREAWPRR